jgi:NADH:ubiquinone oxidoreductase subunit 3 (subunit A)
VTVFLLLWALGFENFDQTDIMSDPYVIAFIFTAIMLAGVYYALAKEKILWI